VRRVSDSRPTAGTTAPSRERLLTLLAAGRLDLPLPGGGATVERLAALADLGADDLVVARLAEAHTDALAILADLGEPADAEEARLLWGVWAADPPGAALEARRVGGAWTLTGTKPWCSGATTCGRALVTAHADDGYRLFALDPRGGGVRVRESTWAGPGMAGADTRAVDLDAAPARAVGGPGAYLDRPGFWWGAAGVAAVWLGGSRRVAEPLRRAAARHRSDLLLASLGRVDAAQHAGWCALLHVAQAADAGTASTAQARLAAARARAVVEIAVEVTLGETARGTGPAPLATDAAHARHVADLQVYVRQSHGDRDLATLGALVLDALDDPARRR
jgi:alkylation response protein AidB-like acyl-CoA dehydrogenase